VTLQLAVVDTGPLYAAIDGSDAQHAASVSTLERTDLRFVIPSLVVAEVCLLVGTRLGAVVEAKFLASLSAWDVRTPGPDEWTRIGELAEQYADFPFGGIDASVVSLAEKLGTDIVVTLDRRHFSAVRPNHCSSFQLLPD
jgi:predicted nucleic acid-binding protein